MGKKPKGFFNPFYAQRDRLKVATPPPATVAPVPAPKPVAPIDETRLFDDEMAGVAPLAADPRGKANVAEPPPAPRRSRRAEDDAEAYAQLADLVDGQGAFDISATDEFVEGLAPGIDRRLLKKLRRGEYAMQAHVDLHGLIADEARATVERFLEAARVAGQRAVLIIHGRGMHSKDGEPVLKRRLESWLTRGALSRQILAFCTARPSDGGPGALYVLLRAAIRR